MKAIFRRVGRAVLALSIILSFWSCTEKPETVGLELLDDSKPFVGKDTTFTVFAYSSIEDSVVSDETSINLLGSIYTETFGRSNSSFYTQLRISSLNPQWGDNPVADSVVFTMVYEGSYGNIETEQTVRAYRLLEDIHWDSTYYSNVSFVTSDEEMAVHTFYPDLSDILVIDSGGGIHDSSYINAELRIPFDNSFAEYMFNLDTSHTSSSTAFLEEFNGIYLRNDDVSAAGEGATLNFDLLDARSNLTIYYKNDAEDSLSFKLLINLNNARVGQYEHEYELSMNDNFLQQVVNGDSTRGEELLYLHGTGGIKTNIFFPGVEGWADGVNRVINEARLKINLVDEYDDDYPPSNSLILFQNIENGSFDFVVDQLQGENYFNGKYDKASNSYFFRITMHLQSLLGGSPDYGLGLFPNAKSIRGTQMKIYGTNNQNPLRFQLDITYTDIE